MAFVLTYMLIDFLRNLFGVSGLLALVDAMFAGGVIYMYVMNRSALFISARRLKLLLVSMGFYAAYLLAHGLVVLVDSPLLTSLALRSYLAPLLFIFVGTAFGLTSTDGQKTALENSLLVMLSIAIGFALVQVLVDTTRLGTIALSLLTPMEHATHSFEGDNLALISSFFASSKRFGRFVLLISVLIIVLRSWTDKKVGAVPLIALLGAAISGSREAFYGVSLLLIYIYFKGFFRVRFVAILLACLTGFILADASRDMSRLALHVDFLIGGSDRVLERAILLLPFLFPSTFDWNSLVGFGLGSYGQEASFVAAQPTEAEALALSRFDYLPIFTDAVNFADSGFSKILIEVGYLGLGLWLLVFSYLVVRMWRASRRGQWSQPYVPVLFAVILIALIAKGHPVLSDLGYMGLSMFTIGAVIGESWVRR